MRRIAKDREGSLKDRSFVILRILRILPYPPNTTCPPTIVMTGDKSSILSSGTAM